MNKNFPILIAEDNHDDAKCLQRALRDAGFNNPFHICHDGNDVISYLKGEPPYEDRDRYKFPRVMIVDLRMPRCDGFELLGWIRSHVECNVIPRIVLSTSDSPSDVHRAYQLGCNSYLHKPPTFEGLVEKLSLLLRYWEMCEKPMLPAKC
jgi:CheY-like chemotaxis protein